MLKNEFLNKLIAKDIVLPSRIECHIYKEIDRAILYILVNDLHHQKITCVRRTHIEVADENVLLAKLQTEIKNTFVLIQKEFGTLEKQVTIVFSPEYYQSVYKNKIADQYEETDSQIPLAVSIDGYVINKPKRDLVASYAKKRPRLSFLEIAIADEGFNFINRVSQLIDWNQLSYQSIDELVCKGFQSAYPEVRTGSIIIWGSNFSKIILFRDGIQFTATQNESGFKNFLEINSENVNFLNFLKNHETRHLKPGDITMYPDFNSLYNQLAPTTALPLNNFIVSTSQWNLNQFLTDQIFSGTYKQNSIGFSAPSLHTLDVSFVRPRIHAKQHIVLTEIDLLIIGAYYIVNT